MLYRKQDVMTVHMQHLRRHFLKHFISHGQRKERRFVALAEVMVGGGKANL